MTKIKDIFENKFLDNNYISKNIINPCRDWIILLALLLIMIVSSIAFNFITYQKIVKGEMYISVKKEELTLVNLEKDKINMILDSFQQKKDYISKIKIESLIDPSI
jgi:hypothetical protein